MAVPLRALEAPGQDLRGPKGATNSLNRRHVIAGPNSRRQGRARLPDDEGIPERVKQPDLYEIGTLAPWPGQPKSGRVTGRNETVTPGREGTIPDGSEGKAHDKRDTRPN